MKLLCLFFVLATSAFAQRGYRHYAPPPPRIHVYVAPTWGYYGYPAYYPYYGGVYVTPSIPSPCKKETMKDSDGKKHDVLVCRQPDGSYKVTADANQLSK